MQAGTAPVHYHVIVTGRTSNNTIDDAGEASHL